MAPVAQTLHAYRDGHREVARYGALDDVEASLIDRLSDLSGYVPAGHTFDRYFSGYPCGRYYAVAATWPDASAPRTGAVLTHTVLFSAAADRFPPLAELRAWLRRPASAQDAPGYAQGILPLAQSSLEVAPIDGRRWRTFLRAFCSTPDRPIVWIDQEPAEGLVDALWELLPRGEQRRLAFCTMALGARRLTSRPFDLLIAPAAARTLLVGVAASRAELVADDESSPRGEGPPPDWLAALTSDGPRAVATLDAALAGESLRLQAMGQFAQAFRFVQLRAHAASDLIAARARADLLALLWPRLRPTHPAARAVIATLLALIPSRVERAGPAWWDWNDFFRRRWVRSLMGTDEAFLHQVVETLRVDASDRLRENPGLWRAWLGWTQGLQEPSLLGVADAVSAAHVARSGDGGGRAAEWLEHRTPETWDSLIALVLDELQPTDRVPWMERLLVLRPEAWVACEREARARTDAHLGLTALRSRPGSREIDALRSVSAWPGIGLDALAPLASDDAWLEWMITDGSAESWQRHAGRVKQAMRALSLGVEHLVERAPTASQAAIILAALSEMLTDGVLRDLLRARPLLARVVALLANVPIREDELGKAFGGVDATVWLDSDWLAALDNRDAGGRSARPPAAIIVARFLPSLLQRASADGVPAVQLSGVLASLAVRRALARGTVVVDLLAAAARDGAETLILLLSSCSLALDRGPDGDAEWVPPLLRPVLTEASAGALRSAEHELAALLARLPAAAAVPLGVELVLRIRERPGTFASSAVLVPLFAPMHRRILREDLFGSRWWFWSWDRGAAFRAWVAELWIERQWSGESLVAAMARDSDLAVALLGWLEDRRGSRAARLLRDVRGEIERDQSWPPAVRDLAKSRR